MWYEAFLIAIGFLTGWVVLERPHWVHDYILTPVKEAWNEHVVQRIKRWWRNRGE